MIKIGVSIFPLINYSPNHYYMQSHRKYHEVTIIATHFRGILAFCPLRAGSHCCNSIQQCLSCYRGWPLKVITPHPDAVITSGSMSLTVKMKHFQNEKVLLHPK